jgi:hypothetical protein
MLQRWMTRRVCSLNEAIYRLAQRAKERFGPLPDWGYSVRINHPRGDHEYIGLKPTSDAALGWLKSLQRSYGGVSTLGGPHSPIPGPYRLRSLEIVPMSRDAWKRHARRGPCTSPDCPRQTTASK